MTALHIRARARASRDIDGAVDSYLDEGGVRSAQGFVDELQALYALLLDHPHIGSPRYAHELNVPGLRHRKMRRYPWLVFYIAHATTIEIVRVLNARRDLPATLLADEAVEDE